MLNNAFKGKSKGMILVNNNNKSLMSFVYKTFMKGPVNCFVSNHRHFEKFATNFFFQDTPPPNFII